MKQFNRQAWVFACLAIASAASVGNEPKGIFGQEEERQFGRWTLRHNGLEGGSVFDVAYRPGDGNVAYAGTVLGPFKSLDGGQTWQPSRTGLFLQSGGDGIAFSPDDPDELYIGTLRGPFTSRDAGSTWTPINASPANGNINGVVVDPNDPDHLVGVGRQNPPAYLESFDRGQTWTRKEIDVFGSRGGLRGFVFDPDNSANIFASVQAFGQDVQGVARSLDGGASWVLASAGLNTGGDPVGVVDLAIDLDDPTRIFAAAGCNGVFRSEDSGNSWSLVHDLGCEEDVDVDSANPNRVVASSGVSLDGGDTWQASFPGGRSAETVAIRPGSTTDLLSGIDAGGTFVSTSNGADWQVARSGLGAGAAVDLAFVDSMTAFAAVSQTGIFLTMDRGRSWTAVASPLDLEYEVIEFSTDPRFGYAGTENGVARTVDGGVNWALANTGMENLNVVDIAVDPTDPMRVFAAVDRFNQGDLWVSLDGGASWAPTNVPINGSGGAVQEVEIDPRSPQIVYAGISDPGEVPARAVYRSVDGGNSWSATDGAIDAEAFGVTALAIDPEDPTRLFAGTVNDGLFMTTDSGGAWVPVPAVSTDIRHIAIDPEDASRIFAGRQLSEDGGLNWAQVGPNFPGGRPDFPPGDADVVFLTGFRGVFERRLAEARERLDAALSPADRFGTAVAIGEQFIFVGLPGDDDAGSNAGAVVVYERSDDGVQELQRLTVPAGFSAVNFGASLAVENEVLVVGAPDVSGEVAKGPAGIQAAIFERLAQGWTFKQPLAAIDGAPGDEFGATVAISGGQIAVGAPGDRADMGAAHVFDFSAGVVTDAIRVEPILASGAGRFGQGLALKNGVLAVGQPGSALNNALQGSVDLFDVIAGNLAQLGSVTPNQASAGDEFGAALALTGESLWIGAPGDADDEGRVFRFDLQSQIQAEVLTARIPVRASRFGASLTGGDVSIVVGAPSQLTAAGRLGEATVFEQNGIETQLVDTVIPDEQLFEFGAAVATIDGNILIGAPATADDAGAALLLSQEDTIFANGFELASEPRRKRFAVTDLNGAADHGDP